MASFDKIKPGDVLWDCRRTKMGNTTMSRMGSWPVEIVSVDREKRCAVAIWNGNSHRPTTYYARQIERLRRSPHKTREERAAEKARKEVQP